MKQRMYSLVLRQLNPLQKGVQTTHAVVEFGNKYSNTEEYKQWAEIDKTLIILDGGIYNDMLEISDNLTAWGIPFARFYEPDLNNMCTAITFLADERIWNHIDYPDFERWIEGDDYYLIQICTRCKTAEKEYIDFIGGEANLKLRQFIRTKHLAM